MERDDQKDLQSLLPYSVSGDTEALRVRSRYPWELWVPYPFFSLLEDLALSVISVHSW